MLSYCEVGVGMKAHLREVRAEDEDGKTKVMSSIKLSKTKKYASFCKCIYSLYTPFTLGVSSLAYSCIK